MTEAELKAVWARWMHRSDLTADIETVFELAVQRVSERLLVAFDMADVLAESPRMLIHAGLIDLHEIAQDDQGMQREGAAFERAVTDYSIHKSRTDRATIDPFTYGSVSDAP